MTRDENPQDPPAQTMDDVAIATVQLLACANLSGSRVAPSRYHAAMVDVELLEVTRPDLLTRAILAHMRQGRLVGDDQPTDPPD